RYEMLQVISSLSTTVANKLLGEVVELCVSFPSQSAVQPYSPDTLDALQSETRQLAGQYSDLTWHEAEIFPIMQ
ncbi:IclR family transcriptional regulator, partial [Erwinia amylovora]|nr:IclR family transcriptional regulator [Erwinia amylovora]